MLLPLLGPATFSVALPLLGLTPQVVRQTAARDGSQALAGIEVPLVQMPGGPVLGLAPAVSFLDYDGDGWIDLYVHYTGALWRNSGGTTFMRAADLDRFLHQHSRRYGSTCGDFDNDGLPDIACEPRADCLFLLKNLDGHGNFLEIAGDPALVLEPPGCFMFAETFCWADVDEDGDLDLWTPAYPDSVIPGSGGNQFLENLGLTGPGSAYRLQGRTLASGLGNPPSVSRPEGAQFVDLDRDGDLDAFANGTLYQNVTGGDGPRFRQLVGGPTGITLVNRLDEGVLFFDYDLDGDQDLFVLYHPNSVLWESEGDGTFLQASDVLDSPGVGDGTGCSAEDWDLDGDLDLTTAGTYRRNMLVESGLRFLRIATESLPAADFSSPAWADWDKDGDLDCVLVDRDRLGRFYLNSTYGPGTQLAQKVSFRVRPVRDSSLVSRGLETEFGATVEVRVRGDASGYVRRRFVASSHGYLQQGEYALTLALPPGPDPLRPALGVTFDLLVDFPSLPANGVVRIDRHVNPVLGDLALARLVGQEITVSRSGRVRIDGVDYPPRAGISTRLFSSGAMSLPAPGEVFEDPVPAPQEHWSVGMELDTNGATGPVRVEELVLDGQLAPSNSSRCGASVILLDVTPGAPPRRVYQEDRTTSPRNDRSFLAVDWLLKPKRVYRVLCSVTELRASPLAGSTGTALVDRGALSFARPNPCDDGIAVRAGLESSTCYFELRYRPSRL